MNAQDELNLAKQGLEKIKADNSKRISDLRAEIDRLDSRNLHSADVVEKLTQAKVYAEKGEELALRKLQSAQKRFDEWDADHKIKLEAVSVSEETKRKTAALRAWVKNGGDTAGFETAYPTIREELLKASVIASVVQQDRPRGLSVSL